MYLSIREQAKRIHTKRYGRSRMVASSWVEKKNAWVSGQHKGKQKTINTH